MRYLLQTSTKKSRNSVSKHVSENRTLATYIIQINAEQEFQKYVAEVLAVTAHSIRKLRNY